MFIDVIEIYEFEEQLVVGYRGHVLLSVDTLELGSEHTILVTVDQVAFKALEHVRNFKFEGVLLKFYLSRCQRCLFFEPIDKQR